MLRANLTGIGVMLDEELNDVTDVHDLALNDRWRLYRCDGSIICMQNIAMCNTWLQPANDCEPLYQL